MKEISVPEYILKEIEDALRIAANILDSRKEETSADRSIAHSEKLIHWVLSGKVGNPPSRM